MSLDVSPELEAAVRKLVRSGVYHSADEVLETALHMLEWAEGHPDGKRELLRHALQAGVDDEDAGNLIDAEEVFRRARERARGEQS
jgi:putative addiction module CopG family antidote